MKIGLRRIIELFSLLTLLLTTQACAETQLERERRLVQKAIELSSAACAIYPAIKELEACVDKVTRKILADRNLTPEQVDAAIRAQEAASATKHPGRATDVMRTKKQLRERALVYKLMDIIDTACAIPPAITEFEPCMEKAFRSIFSSRDPHSEYLSAEAYEGFVRQMSGEFMGIGVAVMYTKDKAVGVMGVMEGSPAERAGIQDGDRIVTIIDEGQRIATSSLSGVEEAIKRIKGRLNTSVTLEILRGEANELVTVNVVRGTISTSMVKSEVVVAPNGTKYAYVRLVHFGVDLRKKVVAAVTSVLKENPGVKGVIFDVRGNPGGFLGEAYEVSDAFVDSPQALISIRDNDGVHAYGTAPDELTPEPQPGDVINGLPIGVLVDRGSASASEIFAGVLKKFERSVTIGQGTWRKGTVQRISPLRDGSALRQTESEYLIGSPSDWVAVQCVGVPPDIEYEAEGAFKPKKEMHECDLEGAVVSGGRSSNPNRIPVPLYERDPARYGTGLEMLGAVKVLDSKTSAKNQRIKKLLKIEDKPEGESDEE